MPATIPPGERDFVVRRTRRAAPRILRRHRRRAAEPLARRGSSSCWRAGFRRALRRAPRRTRTPARRPASSSAASSSCGWTARLSCSKAGDSFGFPSTLAHRYRNPGQRRGRSDLGDHAAELLTAGAMASAAGQRLGRDGGRAPADAAARCVERDGMLSSSAPAISVSRPRCTLREAGVDVVVLDAAYAGLGRIGPQRRPGDPRTQVRSGRARGDVRPRRAASVSGASRAPPPMSSSI